MTNKKPNEKTLARHLGKQILLKALSLGLVVIIASCITVNVNFPESAVQRAADDFVRDLYQKSDKVASTDAAGNKGSLKNSSKKKGKVPASSQESAPIEKNGGASIFDFFINSAYAQELNMSSPKAQALVNDMASRVKAIDGYKTKGILCESEDGTLHIKKAPADALQMADVSKLVQKENDVRDQYYSEIQDINKITDRKQTRIRKLFSASLSKKSPPACE